jgi:Putative DNA-binding domain
MSELLDNALQSDQETDKVDFKESLDVNSKGEWCEILKDIVAMANSGGGVLLIGLKDDGTPSGFDVSPILNYDPANITNKIFSYTGKHFGNFKIFGADREGQIIAALEIGGVSVPLIFTSPGNYQGHDGRSKSAFNVGVVYFRHGAKSEGGTSDDLYAFLKREIEIVKQSWLDGIRKVVEAPEGSQIMILSAEAIAMDVASHGEFQLTSNPDAPAVREEDILKNYPYDYDTLTKMCRERYLDFTTNDKYHQIRKPLEESAMFSNIRYLNPKNPKGGKKAFYSRAIIHGSRSGGEKRRISDAKSCPKASILDSIL